MNAMLRLVWSLCFALVASATVGACGRQGTPEPYPNFRVILPQGHWRVEAYFGTTMPTPHQTQHWMGMGQTSYGDVLDDQPSKVIVEALHSGLGGVNCDRLRDRVEVRLNDDFRSWEIVKAEAASVPGNRYRCLLTLSWSRE